MKREIAPEVFRQRLLIDLITTKEVSEDLVLGYLNGIVAELQVNTSGGPTIYPSGEKGKPENQGVEGFVPLIESGISINTWSESGLVAIYIHTCKEFSEEQAIGFTKRYFGANEAYTQSV